MAPVAAAEHRRARHQHAFPLWRVGVRRARLGIEKRHFHPHVRQHARVLAGKADAHAHGGLVAVGGGYGGDHLGGNVLVVGVEAHGHRLAGVHAVDVRLVHVHFHFQGIHVHDGADAGAREAAAGRNGRDHLPRLGRLGDDDAAERGAYLEVLQQPPLHHEAALGDLHVPLGARQTRPQSFQRQHGAVAIRKARELAFRQIVDALQIEFGLANVDANLLQRRRGRAELRLGQRQLRAGYGIVQHRQRLPFAHRHAFFHEHFEHFAGGLGTHRGLAARHNVAGGVQHAVARRRRRRRPRRRRSHLDGRARKQRHAEAPAHEARTGEHGKGREPLDRPPRPGRVATAVDLEFVEKRLLVHRCPSLSIAARDFLGRRSA